MTPDEQLAEWVKGNSIHNPTRDECCPDFSCCKPALKWDEKERRVFAENKAVRNDMLAYSLATLLKSEGATVRVISGDDGVAQ